ncbi:MAG: ParA family protein [Coriobacteriia bacterium]|nr:ParA family protein [Coriobacteriia bacterium]
MPGTPRIGRFTVVTGHYGSGKTNLSINLALDLTATYDEVMLVDLDIVNPYFRSSDYAEMLGQHGVRVISPTFAGTTLDTPSLSGAVNAAFDTTGAVILDVGGDDVGATALGRYSRDISAIDYQMLYVINQYRNLTGEPEEAAALLAEIEAACHLRATGVVNNSHLRAETTMQTVLDSADFASATAALLGLPLCFTTVPSRLLTGSEEDLAAADGIENTYPIKIHVRTPWEDAS